MKENFHYRYMSPNDKKTFIMFGDAHLSEHKFLDNLFFEIFKKIDSKNESFLSIQSSEENSLVRMGSDMMVIQKADYTPNYPNWFKLFFLCDIEDKEKEMVVLLYKGGEYFYSIYFGNFEVEELKKIFLDLDSCLELDCIEFPNKEYLVKNKFLKSFEIDRRIYNQLSTTKIVEIKIPSDIQMVLKTNLDDEEPENLNELINFGELSFFEFNYSKFLFATPRLKDKLILASKLGIIDMSGISIVSHNALWEQEYERWLKRKRLKPSFERNPQGMNYTGIGHKRIKTFKLESIFDYS